MDNTEFVEDAIERVAKSCCATLKAATEGKTPDVDADVYGYEHVTRAAKEKDDLKFAVILTGKLVVIDTKWSEIRKRSEAELVEYMKIVIRGALIQCQ